MNCLPAYGPAPRRATTKVRVGDVEMGGGAPIVVQSMTNTDTADVAGTVVQVKALARAGSELVRITVNTPRPRPRCRTSASSSTRWASTCR